MSHVLQVAWHEVNEHQPVTGQEIQASAEAAAVDLREVTHPSIVDARFPTGERTGFTNEEAGPILDAESREEIFNFFSRNGQLLIVGQQDIS